MLPPTRSSDPSTRNLLDPNQRRSRRFCRRFGHSWQQRTAQPGVRLLEGRLPPRAFVQDEIRLPNVCELIRRNRESYGLSCSDESPTRRGHGADKGRPGRAAASGRRSPSLKRTMSMPPASIRCRQSAWSPSRTDKKAVISSPRASRRRCGDTCSASTERRWTVPPNAHC
jgi:hypothetical protein